MNTIAVVDFETSGLSPSQGARATEVAAVIIRAGRIVDRYQSLMNAGVSIPPFIQQLTGITNEMVRSAPPAQKVMREISMFVGNFPLVAHNASFDQKFWDAELQRIRQARSQSFACSMRVARRIFPNAPNHKLGTLVAYAKIPAEGRHHRALADATMTANLVISIERELDRRYQIQSLTHELLRSIQKTPKSRLHEFLSRFSRR